MIKNRCVFIVGLPKSGTTYIERELIRLTNAFSFETENHFLSDRFGSQQFELGLDQIRKLDENRVFVNKAVWTFFDTEVINRLEENFANYEVIFLGRNPVDLVQSKIKQYRFTKKVPDDVSDQDLWSGNYEIDTDIYTKRTMDLKMLANFGAMLNQWLELGDKFKVYDYDRVKKNLGNVVIEIAARSNCEGEPANVIVNGQKEPISAILHELAYGSRWANLRKSTVLRYIFPTALRHTLLKYNRRERIGYYDNSSPLAAEIQAFSQESYEYFKEIVN